jgi:hypothetical protein
MAAGGEAPRSALYTAPVPFGECDVVDFYRLGGVFAVQ